MTRSTFTHSFIAAARAPRAQGSTEPVTAFTNVTVVDVRTGRLAPGSTILLRGNRILTVGPKASVKVPGDATVVDGAGAFVIPGLWDMHVHNFNNSRAVGTDNT